MKVVIKVLLFAVAYLGLFLIGNTSVLNHPAAYAYIGALLPLLFAFVYLATASAVRRFGAAAVLNGFVLVLAVASGHANFASVLLLCLLIAVTEIVRIVFGYDTPKGARLSFIPFAFSFFAFTAERWTLMEGPTVVMTMLTIPIAIVGMRLAEVVLSKLIDGFNNSDDRITEAYHDSKTFYDGVLTQDNLLARAYISFFWGGTDDVAITQKMLSYIDTNFSGTILDVPCGTAVFTADYWKKLEHSKITCVDYSTDMLEQARMRLDGTNNITLSQGDVGAMEFDDESFDVVMSMNGFHAFPDKLKAFDETCRVLRKGGQFIACFYIRGQFGRSDWLVNHILAPKGWFTPPFHTEEDVRRILQERYSKVEIHTDHAILWCVCEK